MKSKAKVYEVLSVKLEPAEMDAFRKLAAKRCLSHSRLIAALVMGDHPKGAAWIGTGSWTGWRMQPCEEHGRLALIEPSGLCHHPRGEK